MKRSGAEPHVPRAGRAKVGLGLSCDGRGRLGMQPWGASGTETDAFPFLSPKTKAARRCWGVCHRGWMEQHSSASASWRQAWQKAISLSFV